jgi:EmrB/QacA subfamily drug resistance transporter
MTKQAKLIVTIGLMLGMALAALDTTIVGTAMPSIVGKLGQITLYSWVISAYLLTSTVAVPIYGKLADIYGRKPLVLFGIGLFLLGSAACGGAQSMIQLIIFRAIQGLGAGAVLPIVLTIIGDIFSFEERARIQGLFSGVWGISSIIGPALGGLIVNYLSWRWVFFINLPIGLLSTALLVLAFKEQVERKNEKPHLDYSGTLTLSISIVALLFACSQGGTSWSWLSLPSIGLFATFAIFLVLFLFAEHRAAEPILPLTLFQNRIISISSVGGIILGVVMFGITTYVPLFMQGVQGGTAIAAGAVLAPLLLAWPIASAFSGKLMIRYGYRFIALVGTILSTFGVGLTMLFNAQTNLAFIIAAMLVTGGGLGFASMVYTLSVQNAVPWNLRGVATASTQFFRTIGGTVGVSIMGAILNAQMAARFTPIFAHYQQVVAKLPRSASSENVLLEPTTRSLLPTDMLHQLVTALTQGLFWVYLLIFVLAIISIAAVCWLPGGNPAQYNYKDDEDEATSTEHTMSIA